MLDHLIDPDDEEEIRERAKRKARRLFLADAKRLGISDWGDAYEEYNERFNNIHLEKPDDE